MNHATSESSGSEISEQGWVDGRGRIQAFRLVSWLFIVVLSMTKGERRFCDIRSETWLDENETCRAKELGDDR